MSDPMPPGDTSDGFDPDERALCPDDACIGVLDPAGRCKLCGRQGTAAAPGSRPSQSSPELPGLPGAAPDPQSAAPDPAAAALAPGPSADADRDDFADRRLCSDPSCIGVLDPNGHCKVCGRLADNPR